MDDLYMKDASEQEELYTPEVEGMTEEEARKFKEIFVRFLTSYKQKAPDTSLEDWLTEQYQVEMPHISKEEARKLGQETVVSIEEYDKNLNELKAAAERGHSKERWMADKLQEASTGMAVSEYGEWLKKINGTLQRANEEMYQTITTKSNKIFLQECLSGTIAKQAKMGGVHQQEMLPSDFYTALISKPDEVGSNWFDITVKEIETWETVHRYQMRYGDTAESTIKILEQESFSNYILVVPDEQVAEVQLAFPEKKILSLIDASVDPDNFEEFCKDAVRTWREDFQHSEASSQNSWNNYNTRELALYFGKNVALAGLQGTVIGTGLSLATKAFSGEKIEPDEVIQTALKTGVDAGVKSAAAGALVVASSEGGPLCGIVPKGTAITTLANIACVAVENIKILGKVAIDDLTLAEGLDQMGQTSTAMYCGLTCMAGGAAMGAAALSWIPVVGPTIGGLIGGILAYMGGSAFGETIYNGAKKIAKAGTILVKKAVDGVRNMARGIKDLLTDWWPF